MWPFKRLKPTARYRVKLDLLCRDYPRSWMTVEVDATGYDDAVEMVLTSHTGRAWPVVVSVSRVRR